MLFIWLGAAVVAASGPRPLTLDECRRLAVLNNKELRMADAAVQSAYYERKAAYTKYFPRISATGTYMRTDKEIALLSDEQKATLGGAGTLLGTVAPDLAPFEQELNAVGGSLVDALRTDTRNLSAVGVMLTQPIYMGGKIRAYNAIMGYAEQIAGITREKELQDLLVEVDEAYWRVVELQAKRELALSYAALVDTLLYNVEQMQAEGFCTRADVLSVRVKSNEAQVTVIQVENGLAVSRMLLCQLCGLDIDTDITLEETVPESEAPVTGDVETALRLRPELRSLSLAAKIGDERVRLTRSEFMPTVALTGGYLATYPSVLNGFEKRFNGLWSVGVVANIPLLTSGERIYKVRAARAEALRYRLQEAEVMEKVELQVNQCRRRVTEAQERVRKARSSVEQADENLRYARLGLAEGVIPVSNVIEAQTAWLGARTESVTAGIDLHLANVYLKQSMGLIKQ